MNKTNLLKHGSGFTLFELIVVIFIVGILIGINIPNILLFQANSKLKGAARQVVGDLMAARMEAIKHNCNVIVDFENPYTYYIVVDKNSNNAHDVAEPKIKKKLNDHYPGVINIKADTKNIFNSRGAMRRMRRIELQNTSGIINVKISISGRVKIE